MSKPLEIVQFCGQDTYHSPWMMEPFSIGHHTYATDGCICIRVPRRPDVAENPDVPSVVNVGKLFSVEIKCSSALPTLPPENRVMCSECEGEPSPLSGCDACDDQGYTSNDDDLTIEVGGAPFRAKYLRMISDLPGVSISVPIEGLIDPDYPAVLAFRFEGGEGRVMGMRGPAPLHMRAGETFEQAVRETHRRRRLTMIEALVEEGYLHRTGEHAFEIAEDWRADRYPLDDPMKTIEAAIDQKGEQQ